jgi:cysteinyl-tRNA synthetase
VQNYTDIDDKILNRAAAEGISMQAVSERNIEAYEADMARLNILAADRQPRATRCLEGIRNLIAELEQKGAAYSVDGDVYFAVAKANNYGKLSGRDPNQQQQGASGRTNDVEEGRKRHPFDFALWKRAKPGEPSFESPWGAGRPGWHIECSAMVRQELGATIDIHLGGADLIFPHHENEIAQSETASGKPLARYWLHNGMVNVGGTKMSKSLGNFTTIRDLLDSGVSPMTLRFFVLQAHYRKPLDFTNEALEAAATGWRGLNAALGMATSPGIEPASAELIDARARFNAAMEDDLNSSAALACLFDLAKPLRALANRLERGDDEAAAEAKLPLTTARAALLAELAAVLGLKAETTESSAAESGLSEAEIAWLIGERQAAKAAKQFAAADGIRQQLAEQGIELIDKPGGRTEWLKR